MTTISDASGGLIIPDSVVSIKFKRKREPLAPSPSLIGHNWPNVPLNDEGLAVDNSSEKCIKAEEWNLYLPYSDELLQNLYGVGEMFATKGHGFKLNQYLTKGKPL